MFVHNIPTVERGNAMIISASYRTDIPAFYGEWFANRLRAGYCKAVNPYSGQIYTVDLSPEQVDGFVFWTKNIGPLLNYLPEVQAREIPFVVQHSITGYPHELEERVAPVTHIVGSLKHLADRYGAHRIVWRYDPILFTSLTPFEWHKENFTRLAQQLESLTDEVVISFAQVYRKTARNVDSAAREHNFTWDEHRSEAFVLEHGLTLTKELAQIARTHGMRVTICSQQKFVIEGVTQEARCVDADRLARVAGKAIHAKERGNRQECRCHASKDIGDYDSCPHGCVYCYAVNNRDLALSRYKQHKPESEFLFEPAIRTIIPTRANESGVINYTRTFYIET